MQTLEKILIVFVAIEHLYILFIEMFAWETLGKKTFKGVLSDDLFSKTKSMAANQGLYNGFLAAGLITGLLVCNLDVYFMFCFFFLVCVIIAGIYGAITLTKKIFFLQSVPAIFSLIVLLVNNF